jgi:hypothetical protein
MSDPVPPPFRVHTAYFRSFGAVTHALWAKGNLDIERSTPGSNSDDPAYVRCDSAPPTHSHTPQGTLEGRKQHGGVLVACVFCTASLDAGLLLSAAHRKKGGWGVKREGCWERWPLSCVRHSGFAVCAVPCAQRSVERWPGAGGSLYEFTQILKGQPLTSTRTLQPLPTFLRVIPVTHRHTHTPFRRPSARPPSR